MKTYWHQIGAPRKGRNGREEDPFPPNSESLYMHSWRLRLLSWRKIAFFLAPLDRRRLRNRNCPPSDFPYSARSLSAQKEDVNSGGKWVSESRRRRKREGKGKGKGALFDISDGRRPFASGGKGTTLLNSVKIVLPIFVLF